MLILAHDFVELVFLLCTMFNSILYVFSLIISLVEVVLNSDIVIQEASLLSQFDNGLCLVIQMQSLNTIHRFTELINF